MKTFKILYYISLVFLILLVLSKLNLPMISLPKGMQHNTVGELPLVEVMDDGDFFEKDGDEDLTPQNCHCIMRKKCEKKYGNNSWAIAQCYLENCSYCDDLLRQQIATEATAGNWTARKMVEMGWY